MAETFASGWVELFEEASIPLLIIVEIHHLASPSSGTDFKFISGGEPKFGAEAGLVDFHAFSSELDPLTRAASVNNILIRFSDDGVLREIASNKFLHSARIGVKIGTRDMVLESEFQQIFQNLEIHEIVPKGAEIHLTARDPRNWWRDYDRINRWFIPQHPLRMIQTLLTDDLNFQDPGNIDLTTFSSLVNTDISHFVCTRQFVLLGTGPHGPSGVREGDRETGEVLTERGRILYHIPSLYTENSNKLQAGTVVSALTLLAGGHLGYSVDGEIKYQHYDRTASAIRTFTQDEISDFEQEQTLDDLVNSVKILGRYGGEFGVPEVTLIAQEYWNTNSNDAAVLYLPITASTGTVRIKDKEIRFPLWLQGVCRMGSNGRVFPGPAAGATTITIPRPLVHGFCGSNLTDSAGEPIDAVRNSAGTQQTEHTLTASRKATFFITNHKGENDPVGARRLEIVEATAFSYNTNEVGDLSATAEHGDPATTVHFASGDYTIIRNISAPNDRYDDHNWSAEPLFWVYDVTIARNLANSIIARQFKGLPKVKFTVPIRNVNLELGDFISIIEPRYLDGDNNGADSTIVFEITGLQAVPSGDSPGLRISASKVRQGALPTITINDPFVPGDELPPTSFALQMVERSTGERIIEQSTAEAIRSLIEYDSARIWSP